MDEKESLYQIKINSKKMLKVQSPYDQRLIKEIPLVGKEAVENALTVAYDLFTDHSKGVESKLLCI